MDWILLAEAMAGLMMKTRSQRFDLSKWTRWMVPVLLVLVLLGLLAVLVIVALSLLGVTPA